MALITFNGTNFDNHIGSATIGGTNVNLTNTGITSLGATAPNTTNFATGVWTFAKGTGSYAAVYVSPTAGPSGSPTFDTYGNIF